MPALPTLTVSQAQADRLLAAFGSVAAYKQWLKDSLVQYVIDAENVSKFDAVRQDQAASEADLTAQLKDL